MLGLQYDVTAQRKKEIHLHIEYHVSTYDTIYIYLSYNYLWLSNITVALYLLLLQANE